MARLFVVGMHEVMLPLDENEDWNPCRGEFYVSQECAAEVMAMVSRDTAIFDFSSKGGKLVHPDD